MIDYALLSLLAFGFPRPQRFCLRFLTTLADLVYLENAASCKPLWLFISVSCILFDDIAYLPFTFSSTITRRFTPGPDR